MDIFPAIDLYQNKVVRLYKGDYSQMTVYSDHPLSVANDFSQKGARAVHIVDLEGAKTGLPPHLPTIQQIVTNTNLFVQVGGGIRTMETIDRYLSIGVKRVILGTAAITDTGFAAKAVEQYGDYIAVGADIKDGFLAIRGWTAQSALSLDDFLAQMQRIGVQTVICTDISKDGAMNGTNRDLYRTLSQNYHLQIIASGGVSSLEDIRALRQMNLYGAIIGKAYYTGAIDLRKAIEVAK